MDEKTLLERLRHQNLRALDESIRRYGRYVSAVVGNIIGASMTPFRMWRKWSATYFLTCGGRVSRSVPGI